MAANKEFLTDILEKVLAVQQFLTEGLSKEKLSPGCEAQRKNALFSLDTIAKKIQNAHPSIRPRVNTPGKIIKPAIAPPIANVKVPAPPPPIEENEEVYEDPTADEPASDYLSFYPASSEAIDAGGDSGEEQEMYEAMEAGNQQQEDPAGEDDQAENYEDPVLSRPSNISSSSLPPPIIQPPAPPVPQIPEEGEYASTVGMGPTGGDGNHLEVSMAMDWGNVYTMPPKGEKVKVSSLKNVKIKGPLEKLGGRSHKNWQKRFCVLAGPLMYFYEKESSKTYNNYIAVTAFTASLAPKIPDSNKHYAFKMTHEDKRTGKQKDYHFRAVSSDIRDKWLSCIQNAEALAATGGLLPPSSSHGMSSVTLPRNLQAAQINSSLGVPSSREKKRAQSVGDIHQEVEEEGELYEDMAVTEEDDKIKEESDDNEEEYVAVEPAQDQQDSSEEYVDVVPQNDIEQENYEEPAMLQPPPPVSPPPGPPSDVFFPTPTQPKAAARNNAPVATKLPAPLPPVPKEPEVDTNKVYTNTDIPLDKVFVSQWDFAADEPDELRLHRGDLVLVSKPSDSEVWWYGELLDTDASRKLGPAGFFPKNYSTLAFETIAT